jgi:nitrogen regulatory protein P-II 1
VYEEECMKKIEAYIKHERFEFVKRTLEEKGCNGMTISEVKGRGDQKGITLQYRGGNMEIDLIPKIKLEIIAKDKDSETIIDAIKSSARTGKIGDGRIFVSNIERSIRVRTGEEEI